MENFCAYSISGAKSRTSDQTVSSPSGYNLDCNGEEDSIIDCDRTTRSLSTCSQAIFVTCFRVDSRTYVECMTNDSTPSPTYPSTPMTTSSTQSISSITSGTTPTVLIPGESGGFFQPPNLYYFIAGLSAVIILLLLVVMFTVILRCNLKQNHDTVHKHQHNHQENHANLNTEFGDDSGSHFYDSIKVTDMLGEGRHANQLQEPPPLPLQDSPAGTHQVQQPQPEYQDIAELPQPTRPSPEQNTSHFLLPSANPATKGACICSINPCYSVLESQGCSTNVAYGILEGVKSVDHSSSRNGDQ